MTLTGNCKGSTLYFPLRMARPALPSPAPAPLLDALAAALLSGGLARCGNVSDGPEQKGYRSARAGSTRGIRAG